MATSATTTIPPPTATASGHRLDDTDRLIRLRLGSSKSITASFAAGPLPPRTVPSISYENRAQVDIIRRLAERDLWRPLDLVLGYLAAPDLCAVALVCQAGVVYIYL